MHALIDNHMHFGCEQKLLHPLLTVSQSGWSFYMPSPEFSGLALTEGVQTHNLEGIDVQITSVAKTVVDCFKFRNRVGLDVALEALRDAWQTKKMNMDELWHYAKICRMTNVMRPYLESLV